MVVIVYGGWIYNYLCNQCLSPLKLWVRTSFRRGVLDTTLCDKVCQWLTAGWWFSLGTPVSSTNKTNRHDITEILLTMSLSTINLTLNHNFQPVVSRIKYQLVLDAKSRSVPMDWKFDCWDMSQGYYFCKWSQNNLFKWIYVITY